MNTYTILFSTALMFLLTMAVCQAFSAAYADSGGELWANFRPNAEGCGVGCSISAGMADAEKGGR